MNAAAAAAPHASPHHGGFADRTKTKPSGRHTEARSAYIDLR